MKIGSSIAERNLEAVQDTFQKGFDFASAEPAGHSLKQKLDTLNEQYLSIAYEGASMAIALQCLGRGGNLQPWFSFFNASALPHAIQYHIGLGWALAQQQIELSPFLPKLSTVERFRALDGYGYYEAIFRTRRSVHGLQHPEGMDWADLSAYYQGLGRGIWYLNAGEIEIARAMIDKFPAQLRADLWRGIGIACSYAGGCDEAELEKISALSGVYSPNLAAGAVMVAICRDSAGFMFDDTNLACQTWCKQNAAELVLNHKHNGIHINIDNSIDYFKWIEGIELSFVLKN